MDAVHTPGLVNEPDPRHAAGKPAPPNPPTPSDHPRSLFAPDPAGGASESGGSAPLLGTPQALANAAAEASPAAQSIPVGPSAQGEPTDQVPGSASAAADRRRRFSLPILLIVAASALIVGVGLGVGGSAAANAARARAAADEQSQVLTTAVEDCGHPEGMAVGDSGQSLSIDGEGDEEFSGASLTAISCVLNELDVPDYVVSQIESTRALDGTLSASWSGLDATWNYHPDSGLSLDIHFDENDNN